MLQIKSLLTLCILFVQFHQSLMSLSLFRIKLFIHHMHSVSGHTAKNQSYTVMDYESGYLVEFAVLDKRETSLISSRMELFGLIRCLHKLITFGLKVSKICTDQHVMVCKFFRK